MKFSLNYLTIFLVMGLTLTACAPRLAPETVNTVGVTVSILPERYFVERIGGEHVTVNVMVGPGDSPHTYEPKPEQMAALSRSSIYFSIGVEFENAWLNRIASANPKIKVIDLSEGIEKIPMVVDDGHSEHSGESDPHIWTSPALVKKIANRITIELSATDPGNTSFYEANLEAFIKEIGLLDYEIRQSLSEVQNRNFMVFHPGWSYFAKEYGINEISIEIGGTEPSASELADLISTAKKEKIHIIFAQPEMSTQIANYIASEIDGEVILISPLAEDWPENLRMAAQVFKESFN